MGGADIKATLQSVEQGGLFSVEQEFLQLYTALTEQERFSVGHQYQDLVVSCTLRGVDCTAPGSLLDFHVLVSPTHGNCFTLYSTSALGRSSLTGSAYGLSLVLDIQQGEYMRGGQTLAAGARVSIQVRCIGNIVVFI